MSVPDVTSKRALNFQSNGGPRRQRRERAQPKFATLLGAVTLIFVWRVQDLFPILAAVQAPILLTFLALGWFFSDGGLHKIRRLKSERAIVAVWLILALMALGAPFGLYQGLSIRFILTDHLQTFLLTLAIAGGISSFRDVERLAAAQLVGAIVFAWLVVFRYSVGMSGRLGDLPYYDANDLGMLMVGAMPMAVYFLRRRAPSSLFVPFARIASIIAMLLFTMSIAKSGSRGAFIGLMAVALFMLFRFKVVRPGLRVTAIISATVLLLLVAGDGYWNMMSSLLHPTADYNWSGGSDTGRMEIWKRGLSYMLANPILGVGVQCFPVAEGTLAPQAALQEFGIGFKWSTAHNSFVQIGAELGIGGLLLFLGLIAANFRSLLRITREHSVNIPRSADRIALAQALMASLVGFVVTGFFLSQAYGAFIYVLTAIIAALSRVSARESSLRREFTKQQ